MKVSISQLRKGLSGATLAVFLLPFTILSCPGEEFTFSGVQLAMGTTIQEPQMLGPPTDKAIDAEPFALAALVCALVGIGAALVAGRPGRVAGGAVGVVGVVLLLLLRSKISGEVAAEAMGLVQVRYGVGYWLALGGFGAAALLVAALPSAIAAPASNESTSPAPSS